MTLQQLYQLYLQFPSIVTDTRKLKTGDLFFALKGGNFNGNHFAKQALELGAAYAVTDEALNFIDDRIIKTTDVLQTLQQLAKHHREQFSIPFLAITGSNGKTTTKELIFEILKSTFITYATEGNLNNHIGIPLTLLKIKKDAAIAVIEMGANHQKEIEGYCEYAMPTCGLITNCGKAHLEGFGSIEGVIKAKGELFDYIREHNGTAFINTDERCTKEKGEKIKDRITFGSETGIVTGTAKRNTHTLEVIVNTGMDGGNIKTNLVGDYNLPNILAAVAVGKYFKVPDEKIRYSIENYIPSNSRSQRIQQGSNTIILDAYNANPDSMKAAIDNFAAMPGNNKILLLGDMMELGAESKREHEEIVKFIHQYRWLNVVFAGENFKEIKHHYISFTNSSEIKAWLTEQKYTDAQILIKGSRSMGMEKIIE
ncbi:MAG TPA: UDP-N-acetylmuramoyl-tripeptide--D-alanyl-D-alanine ligase [Chitinophagaceae bacterium]|nr:UDP-N-acetylmuramoyl-tripeptide--D-alanyl-D-alanine ligase [Chitinophagaceae bacterium]